MAVAFSNLEVILQELNYRPIAGRSAIRDGTCLQDQPFPYLRRVGELVEQTGLPYARLPNHSDNLPVASSRLLESSEELVHFRVSSDEARKSARCGCVEP